MKLKKKEQEGRKIIDITPNSKGGFKDHTAKKKKKDKANTTIPKG